MMLKQWCILVVLLAYGASGLAQIKVAAKLDSNNILIGDQVRMKIQFSHEPGLEVQPIDLSAIEKEPKIEIIKAVPVDTLYNQEEVVFEQDVILTSFDSGYHFIPSIPIQYLYQGEKGELQTQELAITVRTFPITTDSLSLQPIKDIIEEPFSFQDALPYIAAGLGGILLVLAIIWFIRRGKKKEEAEPELIDDRPAHIIALEQMKALKERQLWQSGQIKEFHTELTYILRSYLERRFKIRALESTTFEIMLGVKIQPKYVISESWYPDIERLLQTADLIKFAKAEPPLEWHEEMFELGKRFIIETKQEEVIIEEPVVEEVQEEGGENVEEDTTPIEESKKN